MVPTLSLDYSSQNGDGTLGLGWTLSGLPSIGRCPRTVAQDSLHGGVNYDANDRFCMEGQRLVVISGTYGANNSEYRTEIEGFNKIIAHGTAGTGPAWFEVHTKSGQTMEFGNTADSQLLAVGKTTARAWAVNKISDTKGNYLTVTYTDDTVNGQAYPTRIDFTGNTGLTPYNSVQFTYNTARPDVTPTYQAGSLQKTTVLLTNVKTYAGASVVSDYQITYELGTTLRHSRITSIKLCDGTGACLAPTTFGWQGSRDTLTMTGTANAFSQDTALAPGDFNADGLIDLQREEETMESPPACSTQDIYLGSQAGTYAPSSMTSNYTIWYSESGTWFHISHMGVACFSSTNFPKRIDYDADGYTDILLKQRSDNTTWVTNVLHNTGGTSLPEVNILAGLQLFDFGDFNGDGRTDFIGFPSGSGTYYPYLSTGTGNFTQSTPSFASANAALAPADFDGDGCTDIAKFSTSNSITYFCNPAVATLSLPTWTGAGVVFGDFNGDGKADILIVKKSAAGTLYLSSGTSIVTTTFTVPSDWGKYAVATGDWNGDSRTDIALIAPGGSGNYGVGTSHKIYLSTGSGFVQITSIANNNSLDTTVSATPGDWNNDGAGDFWLQKPSGDTLYTFAYVPELVTSVSNGLGVTTTVTYDRLNKNGTLYAKDTAGTYPTINLDGAMYVVSRVDASNGIGGTYISTYAYTGAKGDFTGRGFLGFKSRTVTDLQTGIVQTTTYNQAYPYLGLINSETKKSGTITLSTVTNTFGNTNLGGTRRFVFLQQKVEETTDLDRRDFPDVNTLYQYDAYGNPTSVTVNVGGHFIGGNLVGGDTKVTTNTYNNDTVNWFLGRLLTASTNSTVGGVSLTRSSSFSYEATTGLISQEVVEPNFPALKLTTTYTYDAFGNKKIATVSGSGIVTRSTTTNYDTKGEFPTNIVNALNQDEDWVYHTSFGVPTSHTGPNNLTTSWGYDTFARKTLETRPDANKTGVAYFYCNGVNGGTTSCPTYGAYAVKVTPLASNGTTQNGPISWTYFDALSRVIAKDVQGFDGSWIRVATQYDAWGRVAQTSRPYFIGNTPKWTVNTLDILGRVTVATFPDGSDTTYTYSALKLTVKNDLNQSTVTTKNNQGLVASVRDPALNTTTYTYDPFGNLATTTDSAGNVIANTYDLRGRKIASSDPDMGNWTYGYDVLDELTSQTDAKNQTTTVSYDNLGRLTQRVEGGLTSTWVYDTAPVGVGKLRTATGSNGYARVHSYDAQGRPNLVQITVAGSSYTISETYDADGHLFTVTYPSGFRVRYSYNAYGYLSTLKDDASGQVFWTASTRDAELHTLTQIAGNGVTTTQAFNANTGLIQTAQAGAANAAANLTYNFDTLGNLKQRQDLNQSLIENFCYDNLNRLTNSAIDPTSCTTGTVVKTVAYDPLGNITSKSDVGTYVYPLAGQSYPHAVQSITGTVNGVVNPVFTYDANGNMTDGAGRTITYTSFNMAASITQGSTVLAYDYDCEHNRITQTAPAGTTVYLSDAGSGVTVEKFTGASGFQWNEYLFADGRMVGEHFTFDTGDTQLRYFIADHLGSIAVLLDETGAVAERDSYDAWGKRRNPDGTDDTTGSIVSQTTRGFTGQEHIAAVGLINFNARIYDPQLGRFMSPDSIVPNTYDGQSLNRYSYVGNNPLSLTDPDGHGGIGGLLGSILSVILAFVMPEIILPELEVLAGLADTIAAAKAAYAVINFGITGGVTGFITTGKAQGALIGAIQAMAFQQIWAGGLPNGAKVGATALVGGLASSASGGKFVSGFLAAGIGSLAGPPTGVFNPGELAMRAVLGGFASVVGGGKFANGAITAAFAYLAATAYARNVATTGSTNGAVSGPVNKPVVDFSKEYSSPEAAHTALEAELEAANNGQWEYGGFVVGNSNGIYLTELATSYNKLGVNWDYDSLIALRDTFDVYYYDHLHLQAYRVGSFETGMRFSAGDVAVHNFFSNEATYRGTFLVWHGSSYYLTGGQQYSPNILFGTSGTLCSNLASC